MEEEQEGTGEGHVDEEWDSGSRRRYTDAESRIVWRFGYIEGRRDWKSLVQEVKRKPEVFHHSHASVTSLSKRFAKLQSESCISYYSAKFGINRKAYEAKRRQSMEVKEDEEDLGQDNGDKTAMICYTHAESRVLWRVAYIEGNRDWQRLTEEATKRPDIFHHTHANAKSLSSRFSYMTRTEKDIAKFREMFRADHEAHEAKVGKTKQVGERGQETDLEEEEEAEDASGLPQNIMFTDAENRELWRLAYIEGDTDWKRVAKKAQKRPDVFHHKHTSDRSLRCRLWYMTRTPTSIAHFREKFRADHEAYEQRGGKPAQTDDGEQEVDVEKTEPGQDNLGGNSKKEYTDERRKAYSDEESQIIWRFGYMEGRRDWESLAEEAQRRKDVFHETHTTAPCLRMRFHRMTAPRSLEKYLDKFGATPEEDKQSKRQADEPTDSSVEKKQRDA